MRESRWTLSSTCKQGHTDDLWRGEQAHRAGQFLLASALGADCQSRVFYNRVKGEVEEAVRKLPFDGVHIFRPSLLLGEGRESGSRSSRDGHSGSCSSARRYRPVAAAMIRIAKDPARGVHVYESDRIRGLAG